MALTLHRAAQEGITNALQHGKPQWARVSVQSDVDNLAFTVVDDGGGLPHDWQQRPDHYGLRWLTERVQVLHEKLVVENVEPQGVRLAVMLQQASLTKVIT